MDYSIWAHMDFNTGLFRWPTKSCSTHQLNSIHTEASQRLTQQHDRVTYFCGCHDRGVIQKILIYKCKKTYARLWDNKQNFRNTWEYILNRSLIVEHCSASNGELPGFVYIDKNIYIQYSVEGSSKSSLQAKMCKFLAAFVASHSTAWTLVVNLPSVWKLNLSKND